MYKALRQYINKYTSTEIPDEDFEVIKNKFIPKHFRKNQYLLQEGDVCKYLNFIVKGSVRRYTIDEKGIERVDSLCLENWWIGDRESFSMLTPSIFNIEAVEDCDVLLLTKARFEELMITSSVFVSLFRAIDYRNQIAIQKRINAAISLSAEDRYLDLLERYPEFFQRFTQTTIASYLGVSPETLSRIRKKMLH